MKSALIAIWAAGALLAQSPTPLARPVLDAHNCYPYEGQWKNRIDRALGTGFPVAIEQDIAWFDGQAVVSAHTEDDGRGANAEGSLL